MDLNDHVGCPANRVRGPVRAGVMSPATASSAVTSQLSRIRSGSKQRECSQVFLDRVTHAATSHHSYLLEGGFQGLLDKADLDIAAALARLETKVDGILGESQSSDGLNRSKSAGRVRGDSDNLVSSAGSVLGPMPSKPFDLPVLQTDSELSVVKARVLGVGL